MGFFFFFLQVSSMFISERDTTSNSLTLVWIAPKTNSTLEYLPHICESRIPESCVNKTWITNVSYEFTSLKPFTSYNMSVYVRQHEKPDYVNPIAMFVLALTAEGGMYYCLLFG